MVHFTIVRQSILFKLETYTLNPYHPKGRDKAEWFRKALGFSLDNASELARQISFDPQKAIPVLKTQFGQMYVQYVTISGANGRLIHNVRLFWIKETHSNLVRFTNALPPKGKQQRWLKN